MSQVVAVQESPSRARAICLKNMLLKTTNKVSLLGIWRCENSGRYAVVVISDSWDNPIADRETAEKFEAPEILKQAECRGAGDRRWIRFVSGEAMGRLEDQDELWRLTSDDESPDSTDSGKNETPIDENAPSFKDELNLAEFPIAALTDRVPDGQSTLVFEDHLEQRDGPPIVRRLSISGHGKLGLPVALDDQVIVGLIQLTKRHNNFTDPRVHFSRYELIELLGWPQDGHSYRRIEEALNRWVGVVLSYENAWWDNDEKSWVDETFHIIDNVSLYDRERAMKASAAKGKRPKPLSSFRWNEVMFRSFQANNLKQLDLEFYLDLRLPTSKRLYRFLDKRFFQRERVDFDLRVLACEHVGMSREYAPTELKRRLRPALEELEKSGFLEPLGENEKYVNVEKGKWRILFVRGPRRRAEEESARSLNTAEALQRELTERQVHYQVARDLVAKHPLDRIRAKIEVFDWLKEHSEQRVLRNPAGYLVASIRDDYATPEDFVPKMKRPRRKKPPAATDQPELALEEAAVEEPARRSGRNAIDPSEATVTTSGQPEPPATAKARRAAGAQPSARPTREILADPAMEKRLASQWESLPDDLRAAIVEEVNREHGGLLRWPAMMQPLYLERMVERYGPTPPEAPPPSATEVTRRILDDEESIRNPGA